MQPEVLRGLAGRPGFGGRGLLARFLYSLPASLVGRRQSGAPPVPPAVADRYALELHALAVSLSHAGRDEGPALLTLDRQAGELLLIFERDLEPRLAADSGDLAHLAGWAAKLAGAAFRLAALLHLADHLRDGWARPISPDTFAAAVRLADYLPTTPWRSSTSWAPTPASTTPAGCWTGSPHGRATSPAGMPTAAPRGRFPKATDLDPALVCSRSTATCGASTPTPPAPRAAGHPLRGSWSTPAPPQNLHNLQNLTRGPVLSVL